MQDGLVFIVDLNELQDGGDLVPVAMDYTLNRPGLRSSQDRQPKLNEWVRVHSDDDNTLYYAQVVRVISTRDLVVRIAWNTCAPVLNRTWSARRYDAVESLTHAKS